MYTKKTKLRCKFNNCFLPDNLVAGRKNLGHSAGDVHLQQESSAISQGNIRNTVSFPRFLLSVKCLDKK